MSAATSLAPAPAAAFPAYLADLLDRAASVLRVHGVGQAVAFTWWSGGESFAYVARAEWPVLSTDPAPRVVVCRASGDFVCRSLPGDWHAIDPAVWVLDGEADDEGRPAVQAPAPRTKGRAHA